MNDPTLTDICRIEGRCSKCKRRVVKRPLEDCAYDKDEYLCHPCGGTDTRLEPSWFARLRDWLFASH